MRNRPSREAGKAETTFPQVAGQACRMAINVMYYAFNMYHARHFGR